MYFITNSDNDENYFEREEKKLFDQNRYALELSIMKYEGFVKEFLHILEMAAHFPD